MFGKKFSCLLLAALLCLTAMMGVSCKLPSPKDAQEASVKFFYDYIRLDVSFPASVKRSEDIPITVSCVGRFDLIEEAGIELPEGAPFVEVFDSEGMLLLKSGMSKAEFSEGCCVCKKELKLDLSNEPENELLPNADTIGDRLTVAFGWEPAAYAEEKYNRMFLEKEVYVYYTVSGDDIGLSFKGGDDASQNIKNGNAETLTYTFGNQTWPMGEILYPLSPGIGTALPDGELKLVFSIASFGDEELTASCEERKGIEIVSCEVRKGSSHRFVELTVRAEEGLSVCETVLLLNKEGAPCANIPITFAMVRGELRYSFADYDTILDYYRGK